ncbi:MAG: Helix-turn-helix domain protein [Microgenomates group bacterium GW2011_GWC1_49_7]|nr:MAG: Helix-turn-helix domain protein [Microgenomates group bacterium GW2011_GWC1_49_7]
MKTKLISWREAEKKWMKRPGFRRAVEEIEPEYQLARTLIGARLKRKMTQTQLARKVGTKQPVISRIEAMGSTPTVSLLKRVATALDMKLDIRFSYK